MQFYTVFILSLPPFSVALPENKYRINYMYNNTISGTATEKGGSDNINTE
jgi:hypothetical protein